ncbi:MAG: NAD(P)-binding domain-containing protein [Novosphingobium sp.]|nr:NAD(P)-binding domain-containing protein [Novosphingobium sp.]
MPHIGLIGTGNAGQAMACALAPHCALTLFDRDCGRARLAADRAQGPVVIACDAAALARGADLILLSLPSPDASLAVAGEIREALQPGTIVLETSTVRSQDVEALHDLLAPSGAKVIDTAIIGGVAALSEGRATFLAGTSEEDAGPARQVLDLLAGEIFWLGSRGKAMATKLVVNAVAHAVYVVLVEAGALAAAQDIPMTMLQRLLERDTGLMRPLIHRFGERLQQHDFAGGMSTANAVKDSRLVQEAADALGVPLFAIPAAHEVYELALREGLAALDYAAIGLFWEKRLGIDFTKDQDAARARG